MNRINLKAISLQSLIVLFLLFVSLPVFSQSPKTGIFFQAVARDNYSNPAKDRKIFVETSILQTSSTGTVMLKEFHETSTDATGVFSITIGQGTRLAGASADLSSIPWASGPFFFNLKVAISPTAPIDNWDYTKDLVDLGTTSFGTVPYALYAGSVAGFDTKLNVSDTTRMLSGYARVLNLNSLVTNKVNIADSTLVYVTPTQLAAKTFDQATITAAIAKKMNIADSTILYVTPAQLKAKTFDSTSIYNSLALKANNVDLITGLSTKANISDVDILLNTKENSLNKSTSISVDGSSDIKFPSVKSVKAYVDAQIIAASTPDADVNTKGKLQLSGDLTGTATMPLVANDAITTSKIQDGAITTPKIFDASIVSSKIADANITDAKILTVSGSKILGNITGNAATATIATTAINANNASSTIKLATPRNINGVAFDGTSDITIVADAGTLSLSLIHI